MVLLLYTIVFLSLVYGLKRFFSRLNLPPSPWGLPIIGHMFYMADNIPFLSLHSLSKKYGPILYLRLGMVPAIVISNSELAKEVLKIQDQVFASRPYILMGDYALYHFQGVGPVPYNEHWKMMRRICAMELFTPKRIDSFLPLRLEEFSSMLSSLLDAHKSVDMRNMLSTFTLNIITRILMSKRFFEFSEEHTNEEAKQFKQAISHIADEGLQFHISEFVPHWLRWMDWKIPSLKRLHAKKDKLLQDILDQHKKQNESPKDFMSIMLQSLQHVGPEREEFIKALMLELTIAGSDTTVCTVEWMLLELLHNPHVLNKVREEIDAMVGPARMVTEADFHKLEYLQAVVKEVFRLHPPLPLLIPHMSTRACKVAGFDIPKDAFTFVNVYTIGRDPRVWENPSKFWPERFLGRPIDVRGQDFELLPFGSGRRACAGIMLGLNTVHLLVSNLVHGFHLSFAPGKPNSSYLLQERHGTVNWLKTPLEVVVTPRLPRQAYSQVI